jgi:hypothetical protein
MEQGVLQGARRRSRTIVARVLRRSRTIITRVVRRKIVRV